MPWRMILFLFFLTLFIIFAGFNTHAVDINLGLLKLTNVPMFVALFIAFLLGAVVILPLSILSMSKKSKLKLETGKKNQKAEKETKELPDTVDKGKIEANEPSEEENT